MAKAHACEDKRTAVHALLLLAVLPASTCQCKDRPDVLDLMRRHPTWPGSGGQAAAAVESTGNAAAAAAAAAAAVAAQPTVPPIPGPAGGDHGLSDSEDYDSLDAGGVSDDVQDDMQDEVMSDAEPAAAAAVPAPAAPRGGRPRTYTAEEQEVMRDLNLSSLPYITPRKRSSRAMRWQVQLSAEGLPARHSKLLKCDTCGHVDICPAAGLRLWQSS
jgi:hypothetical protein